MTNESYHLPVLVREVVRLLALRGGIFIDGTLGGGGHSRALLASLRESGLEEHSFLIGIDQDDCALREAARTLRTFERNIRLVKGNFSDIVDIVGEIRRGALKEMPVSGILLDLGVSSFQIDTPARGFSYLRPGPLDMRMDSSSGLTAADIVNTSDERSLADIFFRYGEERRSRRIAAAVCGKRSERGPIETTEELAEIVKGATGGGEQQLKSLARVFQALRIAVNDELGVLEHVLDDGAGCLSSLGRMAVISYHSLEDRMVKHFFRDLCEDDWGPRGVGLREPLKKAAFRMVTRRAVTADETEVKKNSRARSAKLRVIEKKLEDGEGEWNR
ncbi:16S rRNA (cytosine(1402)-N(4))-methyltransferase [Prosthecochloris sp. GSB1]|uniref:16S rRNA (cytosine(1402)-N(4))-methyltransferase RsmH n=1 Tax=Prosthecochloris sp. GSB1 TaxID=281093 RepID=UPI000B8CF280|nr:16S rRNA (cytosine(1402)-N(4))-methyltransferase RsmH [Prosthecochloris sp. GSB1]ASQ91507.1 16S rRNA (cytosine(1402)-N(4))-methyltransferase [Prosthecochloris sp. GSB1]